jgi:hypothetical protein
LHTHDWTLPVHVWCIELQPDTANATRAVLESHGYVRTAWQYAHMLKRKQRRQLLLQSELFVRRSWTPEEYAWAPEPQWTSPKPWARSEARRIRQQRGEPQRYPEPDNDSVG